MKKTIKITDRYFYFSAIVLGLVVFILAALGARRGVMLPWEIRLFNHIFGWPDYLRWLFLAFTQFGSASAIGVAVLVSFIAGYRQLTWRLFLTESFAYVLVITAKEFIVRARPYILLNGIHERELFVSGSGFPSGHTAVATALALTIAPHLPKSWRWLPFAWILLVGLSRVYLGVHAPLDIVGGFGIGLMVAAALHFMVNTDRKLPFKT